MTPMPTATDSAQLYHLFLFGGLGFLLGAVYDLFRAWRQIARSSAASVAIQDICFCLSSALLFFLTALAVTGGQLRWYLFFGTAVGFAAYRLTAGRLTARLLRHLQKIYRAAARGLRRILWVPLGHLLRAGGRFLKKSGQNIANFLKKVLKSARLLLYTKKGLHTFSPTFRKGGQDVHD